MPESSKVEIIILNYRGVDDTLELLENLSAIEYDSFGVTVIENGSGDDSSEWLKATGEKYPNWTFIYNEKNLGFAGGCNQGIEIALKKGADYVLLLNNDTTVKKDFLKPLVELSRKYNALTGGLIYFKPNGVDRIWSFGGRITWGAVPGHLELMGKNFKSEILPAEKQTDFIPGCCLLIPRHVIEKIGLLDENYFAYIEDVDFCLRAEKAGIPSYVTSKSIINHKVGQSTGGGYSIKGRYLIGKSSVIFVRKHGDFVQRMKFKILFWIGIIVSSIREGAKGNSAAVREKFKGYREGWLTELSPPKKINER